jgi:hypothetical protein
MLARFFVAPGSVLIALALATGKCPKHARRCIVGVAKRRQGAIRAPLHMMKVDLRVGAGLLVIYVTVGFSLSEISLQGFNVLRRKRPLPNNCSCTK